jgi:hypothetical protein
MAEMIGNAVKQAGTNFVDTITLFLPRVLTTISIIIVGWIIAMALRYIVRQVLGWLRVDAMGQRAGVTEVLRAANLPSAETLIASLVFWLVFLGFLLSAVDVLGFDMLRGAVAEFVAFVPRLVVAIIILFVGFIAANFAWRATLLAAVNARLPSPRLVGGAVRLLIIVLAAAMALEQIAVARTIVLTAFAIAFGAIMLALAIAVGIGGGPIARRLLERQFPEPPSDIDEISHL